MICGCEHSLISIYIYRVSRSPCQFLLKEESKFLRVEWFIWHFAIIWIKTSAFTEVALEFKFLNEAFFSLNPKLTFIYTCIFSLFHVCQKRDQEVLFFHMVETRGLFLGTPVSLQDSKGLSSLGLWCTKNIPWGAHAALFAGSAADSWHPLKCWKFVLEETKKHHRREKGERENCLSEQYD